MEKSEFSMISLAPKSQAHGQRHLKPSSEKERPEGISIQGIGIPRKGLFTSPSSPIWLDDAEKRWKSSHEDLKKLTKP